MAAPPESDRLAIGGYEPVHRVAQSYLGTLWIALHKTEGEAEQLALLRRLHLPDGIPPEARQAIAAAGRDAMELDLPHVLRVSAALEEDGQLAMVYEHAEAEPLRSLQSWANLRSLSFPVGVSLRIACDLLAGLDALHGSVASSSARPVFGGLSPDSVLVSRSGETLLADPLIASSASLLEAVGFNTAKLAYAAPEQVHAVSELTPQADLFTCGALLWELLATRRLLAGSRAAIERKLLEHSLPNINANLRGEMRVTPALVDVVERTLAADPGKRPSSAAQMAEQLTGAGYELASHQEVAQFVSKLSGQRFDRRTAAVRSRSSPQLEATFEWPLEVPAREGAPRRGATRAPDTGRIVPMPSEMKHVFTPAPKSSRGATPKSSRDAAPKPAREAVPPKSAREVAPPTPAREGPPTPPLRALASAPRPGSATMLDAGTAPFAAMPPFGTTALPPEREKAPATPATKPMPAAPPAARPAPRNATMNGLGMPAHPAHPAHPALAPSLPFVSMTPEPFPRGSAREPSPPPLDGTTPRAPESIPAESVPSTTGEWLPFGAPPRTADSPTHAQPPPQRSTPSVVPQPIASAAPASPVPIALKPAQAPAAFGKRAAGESAGWSRFGLPRWLLLTALAASLGLASAVGVGLVARWAKPGSAAAQRPASSEAPTAEQALPAASAAAGSAAGVTPPAAAPAAPATPAPASAATSAPAPLATGAAASVPAPSDLDSPTLTDAQMSQLFALEERTDIPSCSERLSGTGARYSGKDHEQSRAQLLAARREMMRGKDEQAHFFLCGSTAHDPSNTSAQLALAELALRLGDPEEAKAVAEAGLEGAPSDRELSETLADSLALLGDLEGARRTWLATLPGPDAPEQTRRLANSYRLMGDRSLKGSGFARARNYYRRALILSEGSFAASVGLSEALLWQKHSRAALAWVERAARAFPKDSRVQLLFGDALYHNDEHERAKAAWQAALDAQPNLRAAARRLARGKP